MATIDDLPDDLKSLGRVVPAETRALMTPAEFRLRVEYASEKLTEADLASDEAIAQHLHRDAAKLLKAISLDSFGAEVARLRAEIDEAERRQDLNTAAQWQDEMRRLEKANPQVPIERVQMALIADRISGHQAADIKPRHSWRFWKD